jgi:hypothetical protein
VASQIKDDAKAEADLERARIRNRKQVRFE